MKHKINRIEKENLNPSETINKENQEKKRIKKKKKKKNKSKNIDNSQDNNKNNNPPKKKRNKKIKNIINNNNKINYFIYNNNLQLNNGQKRTLIETQINNGSNVLNLKSQEQKKIKKMDKQKEFTDEEINELNYELAIKYDKRSFGMYYISLLRTKHNFIFSFFYNKDYNSKIIKYDLFFINFAIYYGVNAPFFNDDLMHKIYEKKGSYDIINQIPSIIYSTLISSALNILLKILSLSSKDIINFKRLKSEEGIKRRKKNLKFKLKVKFISFFIIGFILLLFFWYYLSIFSVIFKNTQIYLIKDTLFSYALSLFYPFLIYLIPGLFRIPALAKPKKKNIYLYKVSKFLQIF